MRITVIGGVLIAVAIFAAIVLVRYLRDNANPKREQPQK